MLLRLYALSVFGYITASIATYFIERDAEARTATRAVTAQGQIAELTNLQAELALVRQELSHLRQDLAAEYRSPPSPQTHETRAPEPGDES